MKVKSGSLVPINIVTIPYIDIHHGLRFVSTVKVRKTL